MIWAKLYSHDDVEISENPRNRTLQLKAGNHVKEIDLLRYAPEKLQDEIQRLLDEANTHLISSIPATFLEQVLNCPEEDLPKYLSCDDQRATIASIRLAHLGYQVEQLISQKGGPPDEAL